MFQEFLTKFLRHVVIKIVLPNKILNFAKLSWPIKYIDQKEIN